MTNIDIHTGFNVQLDKSNSITSYPSFLPEEIDYWVNTAIERIIKTRYSGYNVHRTGFQQNQKRTDDLRTVVKDKGYTGADLHVSDEVLTNSIYVIYPDDYWIGLGETAFITFTDSTGATINKRGDVEEVTIENIDSQLKNSLSPYRLNKQKAKPLRLYENDRISLYTDGNYTIYQYTLTYISKPIKIDWYSTTVGSRKEDDLSIMPDHMWDEIIITAVRLALENISDNRYQTISQESQSIE